LALRVVPVPVVEGRRKMKLRHFALLLALVSVAAGAQTTQQCVCVSGCKAASSPQPPDPTFGAPVTCTLYKMPGRTVLGSAPTVDASSSSGGIPLSNSTVCLPPDTNYVYGAAGTKACLVSIPAQTAGTTLTYVGTYTYSGGRESGDSTPSTFQSVSALPQPPVPVGLHLVP
jgi:hypothetical protein